MVPKLLLFGHHKRAFPDVPVPLLYKPKDSQGKNCLVTILSDVRPNQLELVVNDVVKVLAQNVQEVMEGRWGLDCALGYAMTVHSSQGLTIRDPRKVWTIDDYLQWSNLAYLTVSCGVHPLD